MNNYSVSRHRKQMGEERAYLKPKITTKVTISATRIDCVKSWTLRYRIGEEEVIDALIIIFSFNIQLSLSNLTALYVCSIFSKEGLTQSYLYSKGGNDE